MKTLLPSLFFFCFFIALISCDDRDDNLSAPNIRIQNLSNQNFARVEVRNDTIFFENITSESFSEYLELDLAYEIDTLRIEADSTTINFVPDTIVNPLPIGLYTYQLNIDEEGELIFNFKVD